MEVERASLWPRRRPCSTLLEPGDSSSSRRQRIRFSRPTSPSPSPPPPPPRPQPIIFADDDSDGGRDREEDDEDYFGVVRRNESETEYDPLEHVYYGSDDAGDRQQDDEEERQPQPQPAAEEEYSDDERPIPFVRRGGGDQPLAEEDDSDEDRPILLTRSRSRTVVRPGPTAPASAPAPAPAMAPPAPPERPPSSCSSDSSSVIQDATVAKVNGTDCGICYLPLKPPIFQCGVGHVVCSRCTDRMGQATSCHKCRAPMPGGYRRCYDMEQLVDSICVPCPHAAHVCAARPVYHGRDDHARACPHAPCHCPGEACGFAGSAAALADHLAVAVAAAAHGWPCTTTEGVRDNGGGFFFVTLRDGFNFVTGGAANSSRFLLLLHMERAPPFGRAVTAFCVHHDRAATARLKIVSTRRYMRGTHRQVSELEVSCTDLSNGMPDPSSGCFRFVVPGSGREEEDATTILSMTPPIIQ